MVWYSSVIEPMLWLPSSGLKVNCLYFWFNYGAIFLLLKFKISWFIFTKKHCCISTLTNRVLYCLVYNFHFFQFYFYVNHQPVCIYCNYRLAYLVSCQIPLQISMLTLILKSYIFSEDKTCFQRFSFCVVLNQILKIFCQFFIQERPLSFMFSFSNEILLK